MKYGVLRIRIMYESQQRSRLPRNPRSHIIITKRPEKELSKLTSLPLPEFFL